jgi:hypothetical protein
MLSGHGRIKMTPTFALGQAAHDSCTGDGRIYRGFRRRMTHVRVMFLAARRR